MRFSLRLGLLILGLLALGGLSGCSDKVLTVHNQEPIEWQSLRGQWVFINYWAQWCKPCIKEIPELNLFAKHHPQATMLGIYYDQVDAKQLESLRIQFNVEYPLLTQDPFQLLGYERPQVLPATVVFDPQGYLRQILIGPQTQESLTVWLDRESSIKPKDSVVHN